MSEQDRPPGLGDDTAPIGTTGPPAYDGVDPATAPIPAPVVAGAGAEEAAPARGWRATALGLRGVAAVAVAALVIGGAGGVVLGKIGNGQDSGGFGGGGFGGGGFGGGRPGGNTPQFPGGQFRGGTPGNGTPGSGPGGTGGFPGQQGTAPGGGATT